MDILWHILCTSYPTNDIAWSECVLCDKKFKSEVTSLNHVKVDLQRINIPYNLITWIFIKWLKLCNRPQFNLDWIVMKETVRKTSSHREPWCNTKINFIRWLLLWLSLPLQTLWENFFKGRAGTKQVSKALKVVVMVLWTLPM